MSYVLYKWQPGWDLPSTSAACLQAEAYLRLSQAEVQVQECTSAGSSPSGQLPALDNSLDVVSASGSEFDAASSIIMFLKGAGLDLDVHLDHSQRALCLAFSALIELKLSPATLYATWCEPESYSSHTRPAYGAGLPLPFNYLIVWRQRRSIMQRMASMTADKVYADADSAYAALAAHLGEQRRASTNSDAGNFFFGRQPSSLDALLFGHLAMHLSAPTSPPQLQQKVRAHPELVTYADHMHAHVFASALPPAPPVTSPEWTARAEAASSSSAAARAAARARRQRQEKADQTRRQGRIWLASVAGLMLGYILITGQYINLTGASEFDDDADDFEDEEA